jgi:uncharacterized iron-regulated membrane protein
MRASLVWLHRWTGLVLAGFVLLEGITGSLLAFRHPLEAMVAPSLYAEPHGAQAPLRLGELAARAEALAPDARIGYFWVDDRQAVFRMLPRSSSTTPARRAPLFDHVFLDPWTGQELGRRRDGDLSEGRINAIPFIYRLHMDLALGAAGVWILGVVALVWTLDSFTGLYLTFPVSASRFLRRWRPAWLVKRPAGVMRTNFDLHRAGGLWFWPILIVFAWSSVMFDLPSVYEPVMATLFDYRSEFDQLKTMRLHPNPTPRLGWDQAELMGEQLMAAEASRQGFRIRRPYGMAYIEDWGVYTYGVLSDIDIQGHAWTTSLWLDGDSGKLVSVDVPRGQLLGNAIGVWLRALHFADLGNSVLYRSFVALFGLVVAMLSVTGVYIWLRKRSARHFSAAHGRRVGEPAQPPDHSRADPVGTRSSDAA